VIASASSFVCSRDRRATYARSWQMLGARYVLEGSVRRAGNRVRLAAQLIESLNGSHVWADRFEGDVDAVFELQDRDKRRTSSPRSRFRLTLGEEEARICANALAARLVYEHVPEGYEPYTSTFPGTLMHKHARSSKLALAHNPLYTPALGMLGFTLTEPSSLWLGKKDQAATYEAH